jgi:hypothetical protein
VQPHAHADRPTTAAHGLGHACADSHVQPGAHPDSHACAHSGPEPGRARHGSGMTARRSAFRPYATIAQFRHGAGKLYHVTLFSATYPEGRMVGGANTLSGAEELARKQGAIDVHTDYGRGNERSRPPHPRTRAERLVIERELARRRAAAKKQHRGALGLFTKEKH